MINYLISIFKKEAIADVAASKAPWLELPHDWFVYEAGQSPAHHLWFCTICDHDGHHCSVDEVDSFEEAVTMCIDMINENKVEKHNQS